MYGPLGCQHAVDILDEGVDPDLNGGGGVVMVLQEDEHLRYDEGHDVNRQPPKGGGEVSSFHLLPLWVRDTLRCLSPLIH